MKVHFATDHAGYEMKNELIDFVKTELGHEVLDHGAFELNPEDDYPDYIKEAAEAVANNPGDMAVILGGSGQGEAMVANRYKGVYATVYYGGNDEILKLSRQHNDSNVLSLGARFLNIQAAKDSVGLWLSTPFSSDTRHQRRIEKF